jgi:hypothetical protein
VAQFSLSFLIEFFLLSLNLDLLESCNVSLGLANWRFKFLGLDLIIKNKPYIYTKRLINNVIYGNCKKGLSKKSGKLVFLGLDNAGK